MGLISALGLRAVPQLARSAPGTPAASVPPPAKEAERAAFLKDLSIWPQKAHKAWKQLSDPGKAAVQKMMGAAYGQAFADEFIKFTKSGPDLLSQHYGPHFPDHTHEWFEKRGFRLAARDDLNEWWVHPSGLDVTQDRDLSWNKDASHDPSKPAGPTTVTPPDDLEAALRVLRENVKQGKDKQADLTREKAELKSREPIGNDYILDFWNYEGGVTLMIEALGEQIEAAAKVRERLNAKGAKLDVFDSLVQELDTLSTWANDRLDEDELDTIRPLIGPDDPPVDFSGKGR